MRFVILVELILVLVSSAFCNDANRSTAKEEKSQIIDKNLEPIFEEIQPEFNFFPSTPSSDAPSTSSDKTLLNNEQNSIISNNNNDTFINSTFDPHHQTQLNNSSSSSSSSVNNNATVAEATSGNSTDSNNTTAKFFNCITGGNYSAVQLVNDTELIKLLLPDPKISMDKNIAAQCVVVLFYSKNCPFSSMAAPHFNALPRAFPDIKMVAINAMRYHLFNTQNGIIGVPTLLLFHNGRAVIRYNGSDYNFESFIKFIKKFTSFEPVENSVVTSQDFSGPVVSSPSKESDIFLALSWVFIITTFCYYFSKSRLFKWTIENVQRNWRESEQHAQHAHAD